MELGSIMSEKRPGGAFQKVKIGEAKHQKAESPSTANSLSIHAEQETSNSSPKGPVEYFNDAKNILVRNEVYELSALEGSIASAVEAATLLERSKVATIIRIQTSYVSIEPKKKPKESVKVVRQPSESAGSRKLDEKIKTQRKVGSAASGVSPPFAAAASAHPPGIGKHSTRALPDREMRRARIVITLQRTAEYVLWLHENPQKSGIEAKMEE